MKRHVSGSLGLVGRIFAILLLTLTLEFAVGTLIYERASHFSLQDDEARRLAEHLVIARKLLNEQPREERRSLAIQLTTDRYDVHWSSNAPPPPPLAPELERMRGQIVAWEPSLDKSALWLRLASPGRHSEISGGLRLKDGSWLYFGTHVSANRWEFTIGRMGLALIPVLALLLIGGILIRRTLAPLRELTRATEQIGLSDQVKVEEAGTNDVRDLIRAFNAMQDRIHRLITERTETLAAVGHDLRTPLARLRLRLDRLDEESARPLEGDLDEMGAMIDSLLAFLGGEKDPEPRVRTDLAVTVATLVDAFQDLGQDVDYEGPDHLELEARALSLRRAIGNLLENALHYGQRARLTLLRDGSDVVIRVDDDGPGIPPERMADVLKPFTRLDTARQRNTRGLGLGLAIVDRAVEREGGELTLSNRRQGGLRAEIRLHLEPVKPA